MKLVAGLLMGVALVAAGPAAAETWRMVGFGGNAPQRSVYLVDTDSISRIGNTIRFRSSTIWEGFTDDRDFNKSITTREGDCGTKASAIVSNNYYANGSLVSSSDDRGEMITHGATSLMRAVLDAVCGDAAYDTERLDDAENTVRAWLRATP